MFYGRGEEIRGVPIALVAGGKNDGYLLRDLRKRKVKHMQEQVKRQHIPVKVYRTGERLMIASPMAGLEPENIVVEVTDDGRLILHGDQRSMLKEVKELLLDEWSVGVYHRELALPVAVNAVCANVTYGNGVLTVALPISDQTRPARLTLDRVAPTHGERKGNAGHPPTCVQT
jgi:HSP20 family protein